MIATWFGPASAPLFGCWHLPDGGHARGAAILCAPLGREQGIAHRSYRVLAERLAEQGVAALRFDYFGTADSAGNGESPDLVAAWLESIAVAVDAARHAGAEHVTLVGLRMGSVLAGIAAKTVPGVDGLVLWDPCASGRSFLREEGALRQLSLPETPLAFDDGAVEGSGSVYSAQTAADLSPLRLPTEAAVPTLLLLREDRPVPKAIVALADGPLVTRTKADEQADLLDVTDLQSVPPRRTVDGIASWIAERSPETRSETRVEPRTSAVVGTVDGVDVTEQIVRLGPNDLFAIASRATSESAPVVLFTPTATNYHPGVGRLAVDAGRRIAATGHTAVRYDPHDLGDSPHGSCPDGPRYYTSNSARDAVDATQACRELFGSDVTLVGLCSGAWAANMALADAGPTAVYLINPLVWQRTAPVMGPAVPGAGMSWVARTFNRAERIPGAASLGVLAWRSLVSARLIDGTSTLLDGPAHRSSRITVLTGTEESKVFARKSGLGTEARLRRRTHLRFVRTDHLDHSLLTASVRADVITRLVSWIAEDAQTSKPEDQRVLT